MSPAPAAVAATVTTAALRVKSALCRYVLGGSGVTGVLFCTGIPRKSLSVSFGRRSGEILRYDLSLSDPNSLLGGVAFVRCGQPLPQSLSSRSSLQFGS